MANDQTNSKIGLVILAAGASSRLGSPKQLLNYAGSTLLQHTIDVAMESNARKVVLVLGANADIIQQGLNTASATIMVNDQWKNGMSSSIRCGLQTLMKLNPETEAVLLMVADQPFVTPDLLNNLIDEYAKKQNSIVASKYGTTFGTPVLFDRHFFPELIELSGDVGAKGLIRKYMNETAFVSFPEGEIDIDTAEDLKKL